MQREMSERSRRRAWAGVPALHHLSTSWRSQVYFLGPFEGGKRCHGLKSGSVRYHGHRRPTHMAPIDPDTTTTATVPPMESQCPFKPIAAKESSAALLDVLRHTAAFSSGCPFPKGAAGDSVLLKVLEDMPQEELPRLKQLLRDNALALQERLSIDGGLSLIHI